MKKCRFPNIKTRNIICCTAYCGFLVVCEGSVFVDYPCPRIYVPIVKFKTYDYSASATFLCLCNTNKNLLKHKERKKEYD